jgi:uncharacterized protein YjbK
MTTEIELKFAVEDASAFDALIRHLDLPAREFHPSASQVNHYFDTQTFALQGRLLALRLREETGSYMLALKGAGTQLSDDGVATERLEEEVRLSPDVALDVLQGTVSARAVLAKRIEERNPDAIALLDEALARSELHYVGRFDNHRTRLSPVPIAIGDRSVPLVFELDTTRFSDERTEFEIEVELTKDVDPEGAHAAVSALLADAGVSWRPAESKAQRFIALVRASRD